MNALSASNLKVLVMAGGTGGHVFPALAVASELHELGASVVWLGSRGGMETELVPKHGFAMEVIDVAGLRGKGAMSWLMAPLKLARAVLQAISVVRRQQPAVVLGMGGFASGPGGLAAWLLRKPLVIHEQNAIAGMTNRLLAKLAVMVLEAFPNAFEPSAKVLTVGNPVRSEIANLQEPGLRISGRDGPIRVLIVGGSLGALALNRIVPASLARLEGLLDFEIWHQAGRTLEAAEQAYEGTGLKPRLVAFIDDMAEAYGWADLVVCRSGALTVAELAAAGLAAVLVPFPYAVDDHQTVNGDYLVQAGAAVMFKESELTEERLALALEELIGNRQRLTEMASAARDRAWSDSRSRIMQCCLQAAGVAV